MTSSRSDLFSSNNADPGFAVGLKLPYTQEDWWQKCRATDAVFEDVNGVITRVGDETVGEMWSLYDGHGFGDHGLGA